MFYRRKILLFLLVKLDKNVRNIDFQKYLFLLGEYQKDKGMKPYFFFVPYKYGGFSFQSYSDKRILISQGYLNNSFNTWDINKTKIAELRIKKEEEILVEELINQFKNYTGDNLVRYVYQKYPYYATKSKILDRIIKDPDERKKIIKQGRRNTKTKTIFNIGYEGKSIDEYFNLLISNNVDILVDVRKNPISMKYGFSKKQLSKVAESLGIKYIHIPELGIESSLRKNLNIQEDYEELFKIYKKNILPNAETSFLEVLTLAQKKVIALTCFEGDVCKCHRREILNKISKNKEWGGKIVDL